MDKQYKPACYCRVSTVHQVDKESIPAQVHMLSSYCAGVLGCKKEDVEFYIDAGYSGKNTKRPEYERMISDVKAGKRNIVVAFKLDRISRNLIDFSNFLQTLEAHGAHFVSLTESFDTTSVMGQSMLKLIALFAEMERGLTRERVMAVSKDIITRGGKLGAPTALGYNYDKKAKTYTINEEEAKTVRWMFEQARAGKSTTFIADYLNDHKIVGKRGGLWTSTTVFHILHNPAYKGDYVYNRASSGNRRLRDKKEWYIQHDAMPVIIPAREWQAVQDALESRRKGRRTERSKRTHLFSNLVTCGECGGFMRYRLDRARSDGYRPTVYFCWHFANHMGCHNGVYSSDVTIAPFVLRYVANVYKLSKMADLVTSITDLKRVLLRGMPDDVSISNAAALYGYYGRVNNEVVPENVAIVRAAVDKTTATQDKELEKYYKALDRLKDLYLYGEAEITKDDYVKERAAIESKIAAVLDERNETAKQISPDFDIDKVKYSKILRMLATNADYRMIIDKVGVPLFGEFFHDVLENIVLDKGKILKITFKNGISHCFSYNQ